MTMMRAVIAGFVSFGLVAGAVAQPFPYRAGPGAPAAAFPQPDRLVAKIVSPIWHTEAKRDAVDETGQLMRLLGIGRGMTVGDLGAGSGYSTIRLARRVGPDGYIFAQDVTPSYLARLARRVRGLKLANVTLARGEPHDPRLPPASLDVALMSHMYHEVAQPYAFLYNLVPALKPGGRVGIVEVDAKTSDHGTPPALLRCELAAVGYRQVAFHTLAGSPAYLAIFAAPTVAERPQPAGLRPCRKQ
jgi:predicted methyltransferase